MRVAPNHPREILSRDRLVEVFQRSEQVHPILTRHGADDPDRDIMEKWISFHYGPHARSCCVATYSSLAL